MSKQILTRNNAPLIFNTFPLIYEIPAIPILGFLNFYTNASTNMFTPNLGVHGGTLNWNLGDTSTSVDSNDFSHTYTITGNKNVRVYAGTVSGISDIMSVNMVGDSLVGTLNVSGLTGLGGDFYVAYNPNLTRILNPISENLFTSYWANDCSLIGVLDVSGLTGLQSDFQIQNNKGLTSVLFPTTAAIWSTIRIDNCGLIETLDISGLTGLGGYFMVGQNPNLQHIINPVSTQTFTAYDANDCNLTGILDLRSLSNIGGRIRVGNNPNLTEVKFPANAQTWVSYHGIQVYSCNITGTLDVSGFSNLGGTFYAMNNPNLNYILNPTSSQSFAGGGYNIGECGLMNTLDLRSLTGLGGAVSFQGNPSLNIVLNPASSEVFGAYAAYNCNLIGTHDVSGFSNLGGYVQFNSNPNLQNIILPPAFNQEFWYFYGYDCSLNITTLDDIFLKLNTYYTANPPTHTSSIYLQGANNAWPSNGWDNINLIGLQTAFSNAGQTVNININDPIAQELFQFKVSTISPYTFMPNVSTGSGLLDWDFGDGSLVNGINDPSHSYSTDGDRLVKVYGTNGGNDIKTINMYSQQLTDVMDISNLTGFHELQISQNPSLNQIINPITASEVSLYEINSTGITGTLDLTGLTGLGGTIQVSSNNKLNHIDFPVTSQPITQINFENNGLIGTLDLSNLTGLQQWVFGYNNPSLNNIVFPTTAAYMNLQIYSCDISGNLDLSPLSGLGELVVYSNPKLTQIINPISNQAISNYKVYDCNLTGILDVSSLTQLSGIFDVHNNPNLTKIILSNEYYGNGFEYFDLADCNLSGNLDVSALAFGQLYWYPGTYLFKTEGNSLLTSISLPTLYAFSEFNVKNCSLNISTVDSIFAKLNTWYSTHDPSFNLIIDAGGGGNSWPTDGSSNTNIIAIKAKFALTAFDVSITINYPSVSLMDYANNPYSTVVIGTQEWLGENLHTSYYANGTPIINASVNGNWAANTSGAWSLMDNSTGWTTPYGYLYNWYAVDNSNGLAYFKRNGSQETGWKVADASDWNTLITYLGGTTIAGGKMKETGTTHWLTPNTGATNESGFTAVGGGSRAEDGTFSDSSSKANAAFWSDTSTLDGYSRNYYLNYNNDDAQTGQYLPWHGGMAVRCVRNI